MRILHLGLIFWCATASGLAAPPAPLPAYPDKPLRLIVPFPPGGGVDIVARIVGQQFAENSGQQVVIDNRTGAAGTLGTDLAAKGSPDGYTMLMGSVGPIAFAPSLYSKLPYQPLKDFAPVTLVAMLPNVLLVKPDSAFNTVQDVIVRAKAQPGTFNYGSAGSGTPPHLAMEMFKTMAGIDLPHIPYKGGPPALADLMGGRVQLMFINVITALPFVRGGKLRALAVTTPERSGILPEVPTMVEAGNLPGFSANDWFGILVPAGTPAPIVNKLNAEFSRIVNHPDMKARLSAQGAEPGSNTPEAFAAFIKNEM